MGRKGENRKYRPALDLADWILIGIMLLAAAGMLYFGTLKEGYHLDEIYSYGLANSEYLPFMHMGYHDYNVKEWMKDYGAGESLGELFRNLKKDYDILKEHNFQFYQTEIYRQYLRAQANSADTRSTTWMTGQDYWNYISASKDNRFNYASVYYNQRGDVHPPFFYILLHTVCSVFSGTFSKWYGIAINILALELAIFLFYRMTREYLGGSAVALAALAGYAFSRAVMTTAMLIRMYSLLTLLVIASCWIHLKIADEDYRLKGRNRRYLVLITFLGFYTHYYFVLYAIAITAVISVCMAFRKKWKGILSYWITLAVTAAAGLCIWPYAIRHVFHGYRGQQAIAALENGVFYLFKPKALLEYAALLVLGGRKWLLVLPVLAATVSLALLLWRGRGRIPQRWRKAVEKACIVIFPVIFYWQATAQIIPMLTDRYVYCLFPFLSLFVVEGVFVAARGLAGVPALQKYKVSVWSKWCVAAGGCLLLLWNHCLPNLPGNLFQGGQETYAVEEGTDCVYVLPDGGWNSTALVIPVFIKCDNVAVVYESDVAEICSSYRHQEGGSVLVAVQKNLETEQVLENLKKSMRIEQLAESGRREDSEAVWIWLK